MLYYSCIITTLPSCIACRTSGIRCALITCLSMSCIALLMNERLAAIFLRVKKYKALTSNVHPRSARRPAEAQERITHVTFVRGGVGRLACLAGRESTERWIDACQDEIYFGSSLCFGLGGARKEETIWGIEHLESLCRTQGPRDCRPSAAEPWRETCCRHGCTLERTCCRR